MFHSILLLFNIFIFFSQTLCKYLGQHTYIVINSINYIINYLLFRCVSWGGFGYKEKQR